MLILPFSLVMPRLLVVKLVSAWLLPTLLLRLMLPVPVLRVRAWFPLTVPLIVILPAPLLVLRMLSFPSKILPLIVMFELPLILLLSVVAPIRVMAELLVPVIEPLTAILPKGDWIFTSSLNVALLSMVIAFCPSERPMAISLKPFLIANSLVAVRLNPGTGSKPFIAIAWVVVPGCSAKLPVPLTELAPPLKLMSFAVKDKSLLLACTALPKLMVAVPAFRALLLPVKVTLGVNWISPLFVVILLLIKTLLPVLTIKLLRGVSLPTLLLKKTLPLVPASMSKL